MQIRTFLGLNLFSESVSDFSSVSSLTHSSPSLFPSSSFNEPLRHDHDDVYYKVNFTREYDLQNSFMREISKIKDEHPSRI